ncbi:MAG: PDZ domain-containing protein, partial [Gemmatimonadetes bacterium]|nr:PDZ domain-containing protein [Gemmatimonadota bacterium]
SAAAATIKPSDRIMAVGQGHDGPLTDVVGWRLDDVVQLIRGKIDTVVRLQVLPAGAAPGVTGQYSNIGHAWVARVLVDRLRDEGLVGARAASAPSSVARR